MSPSLEPVQIISLRRSASEAPGPAEVGGKAQGLLEVRQTIARLDASLFPSIKIDIPAMAVLGASVFDAFMQRNQLDPGALARLSDERIAHAFQRGDLPFEVMGQLRALAERWPIPLAVRSSSLLEDSTQRPFAGVYATKMIPNHWPDPDTRFRKLVEAVKFVWASTYFRAARDYCAAGGVDMGAEKMAVIIQEMVGKRYRERFYPELSGVARSYNYYPLKPALPHNGVVSLALGLGKTIVDGGKSWTYCPLYPQIPPPYKSLDDLIAETQNEFWAVNLGEPPEYNPIQETEYLRLENLNTAERDGVLANLVSTYDPQAERLSSGVAARGPRVLTFAPLLQANTLPFNLLVNQLLSELEGAVVGQPVEIEFAMTFNPPCFRLLQVRPMAAPRDELELAAADLSDPRVVIASDAALGNGAVEGIADVVYVLPDKFELKHTRKIAAELARFNHALLAEKRPYLLIVFGRLGTLDPWLGIPVSWSQVCGASVIVEATQENVKVELSQGSHYFHNLISLDVKYFALPFSRPYRVNWQWLDEQPLVESGEFTRRVRLAEPLSVKVDGRSGRGVITRA